jgi:hypothetical protein
MEQESTPVDAHRGLDARPLAAARDALGSLSDFLFFVSFCDALRFANCNERSAMQAAG